MSACKLKEGLRSDDRFVGIANVGFVGIAHVGFVGIAHVGLVEEGGEDGREI